jgi:hypothetical protein
MPLLSVTNLTTSAVEIQDPSGLSGLSYKVPASGSDTNRKLTLDQLAHLEPQLKALKAASRITYTVADDPASQADNPLAGALRFFGAVGHNGVGAVTLTGAKVGDVVIGVVNVTDGASLSSSFESKITVADQIQQSSVSDLSTKKLSVLLVSES